jgi:hypothetical protein
MRQANKKGGSIRYLRTTTALILSVAYVKSLELYVLLHFQIYYITRLYTDGNLPVPFLLYVFRKQDDELLQFLHANPSRWRTVLSVAALPAEV